MTKISDKKEISNKSEEMKTQKTGIVYEFHDDSDIDNLDEEMIDEEEQLRREMEERQKRLDEIKRKHEAMQL